MYLGISMTQSTEHQTGILPYSEPGCVASTLALELPAHWEPMKGEDFKKVELQPDSPEYQEVAVGFCKANNYNIHKVSLVTHKHTCFVILSLWGLAIDLDTFNSHFHGLTLTLYLAITNILSNPKPNGN